MELINTGHRLKGSSRKMVHTESNMIAHFGQAHIRKTNLRYMHLHNINFIDTLWVFESDIIMNSLCSL